MRVYWILGVGCISLTLLGCQTSPAWNHPRLQDPGAKATQLSKDDTECTLWGEQYSASGQVVMPPSTQSFTATGRTYNFQTGATTYSSYSGQVGAPSGGFAGGFASGVGNGLAIGQAIRAARIQEMAYRHCMTTRGWVDSNEKGSPKSQKSTPQPNVSIESPEPYSDAQDAWKADAEEFLRFFPSYRTGVRFDTLNERVKALAKAKSLEGPQYLVEALESIEPGSLKLAVSESEDTLALYLKAVRGDARAQAGLGLAYVQKQDSRTPFDPSRSAYWSRKSAMAGNSVGQLGYGLLLFSGGVRGEPNRVAGYRWVSRAGDAGVDIQSTLRQFEGGMTKAELQQVNR